MSGNYLSQAGVWGGLGRRSGTLGVSGGLLQSLWGVLGDPAFQGISQHCWEGLLWGDPGFGGSQQCWGSLVEVPDHVGPPEAGACLVGQCGSSLRTGPPRVGGWVTPAPPAGGQQPGREDLPRVP